MPFLLVSVAFADIVGVTFTIRQGLTQATTFRDCTFRLCRATGAAWPDNLGGALYLSNTSASLFLAGCVFDSCRASYEGGALWVSPCRLFSMNETSGVGCFTNRYYSFGDVGLSSTATGSLEVREFSVSSGASAYGTIRFFCSAYSSGNKTVLHPVNSSANSAAAGNSGSALGVRNHFGLSLRFSTFSRNIQACCLGLDVGITNGDIFCVSLVNNSCQSDPEYPGLIHLCSTLTMSTCVFQANTFDYFLGSRSTYVGNVTFANCVFDVPSLSKTNSVHFGNRSWIYQTRSTALPECLARTPTRTRSPTPRPSPHSISATEHSSIALQNGQEIVVEVSAYPLFLVLPTLSDLRGIIYNSDDEATANFSSPTKVFAVYFSRSGGHIVFTARAQTALRYFAIRPPFDCPSYFLSTSPSETWSATRAGGNFTLGGLQDICLLHVSDNVTDVKVKWDTSRGIDFLDFEYSGTRTGNYTGSGTAWESASYFAAFRWHSGPAGQSNSFSVALSSPGSSLQWRTGRGAGTSQSPIVLEAAGEAPPTAIPTSSKASLSGGAIAGIVAGCVVVIVVLVVVLWKVVASRRAERGDGSMAAGLFTAGVQELGSAGLGGRGSLRLNQVD